MIINFPYNDSDKKEFTRFFYEIIDFHKFLIKVAYDMEYSWCYDSLTIELAIRYSNYILNIILNLNKYQNRIISEEDNNNICNIFGYNKYKTDFYIDELSKIMIIIIKKMCDSDYYLNPSLYDFEDICFYQKVLSNTLSIIKFLIRIRNIQFTYEIENNTYNNV